MSNNRLRILQVMRAPVGGLFRHVSDLTRSLAERGHQVGIVADSDGDAQSDHKLGMLEPYAQLGIHRLPMPRVLGLNDITTPARIRALAKSTGAQIVHGHGAKGGFGARLARIGRKQTRAIYTPHGGALHFDPRSLSGGVFMTIERSLLRLSDALIFESHYAQKTFASHVGVTAGRQEVIHNGLDDAEFVPITPDADAADFAFVGELRTLKGIDLIIAALAGLTTPDGRPATIIMAGDGPDGAALRERIEHLGMSDRVALAGIRPAREIFAKGRCVLVPSRAESLPYIIMEAAAAGRPIIATNVGGVGEIFGPTSPSLIVPGDADPLRQAMAAFLSEPKIFEIQAEERRDFVRSRFSLTHMVDQIEALYDSLTI
ncbi:glycosyltransferase [Pelagibacterium sp.]|uniref:glycosyltransferase n=1 Tax=Pelagibacterium sp. TaxID=1967288 RepID=UPI003A955812